MKFLTLLIITLLFSGPPPELAVPINFIWCAESGFTAIEYQIRSDSTIVYRRHDEQFKGDLRLSGWWKYSNATLEWKKTDEAVSMYALDAIGYLAYLIPKAPTDEYVRLKEQITTCVKENATVKEMDSWGASPNTPEAKRTFMQRVEFSVARRCVCGTNVMVEVPEPLHIKSDFDSKIKVKR
jgi:hypothetical protein